MALTSNLYCRHELKQAEYLSKPPSGKQSVKGMGRTTPNPAEAGVTASGAVIPYGKPKKAATANTVLLYNEYPFISYVSLDLFSQALGRPALESSLKYPKCFSFQRINFRALPMSQPVLLVYEIGPAWLRMQFPECFMVFQFHFFNGVGTSMVYRGTILLFFLTLLNKNALCVRSLFSDCPTEG